VYHGVQIPPWEGAIFEERGAQDSCVRWSPDPHGGKGQFLTKGAPIVNYSEFLPCAVQKQLNR